MSNPNKLRLALKKPVVIGQGDDAKTYTHIDLTQPLAGQAEKALRADTNVGRVLTLIEEVGKFNGGKVPRLVAEKGLYRSEINQATAFFASFSRKPGDGPPRGVDSFRLEFSAPIVLGVGEGAITYTHVDLECPNAGELERASRADTNLGTVINMVHLVGKVPRWVAEQMTQRDIEIADKFFDGFEDGPEAAADGLS